MKHSYLCSDDCFKKGKGGRVNFKVGSAPTRFIFTPKKEKQPLKGKAPVNRTALPRGEDNVNIPPAQEPTLPINDPLVEAVHLKEEEKSREELLDQLKNMKEVVKRFI